MKNLKRIFSTLLAIFVALGIFSSITQPDTVNAALNSNDFLKTDGKYIKNNYGTGQAMNLRGTNLGGWLTFEDWMAPTGEFAFDRTGWVATTSINSSSAGNIIDGDNTTRWSPEIAQEDGQWFQVDMGYQGYFNRIYVNGGLNVGYIDTNDWMDYVVNVPAAGTYTVSLRIASQTGASNAIELKNGSANLAVFDVPNTGAWQGWTTVSQNVTLDAGVQTLQLYATAGNWNINWLELKPTTETMNGNLLQNAGFESGSTTGWDQWNGGIVAQAVDTSDPYMGTYKLTHWASSDYQQLTRQTINVPNGTYRFSSWVRSSGGQKALHLYAKTDGREMTATVASNAADYWEKYTIDNIVVTTGQIEVGVWSNTHTHNWAAFDQFELIKL